MKQQELFRNLGITQRELTQWVSRGLPRTKDKKGVWNYDEQAVAKWIRQQALAKNPPPQKPRYQGPIARTFPEAVRMLAEAGMYIGERTLHTWSKLEGFPGTPGTRGQQNGIFPIPEIMQWAEGNAELTDDGSGAVTSGPRSRLMLARASYQELLVREKEGLLVPRQEAIDALRRQSALMITMLEGFPDEAASLAEGETAKKIRDRLAQRIERLRESLADQLEQEEISRGDMHHEDAQPPRNKP